MAFEGEPDDGMEADHIDFNTKNNNLSNLQWLSGANNNARKRKRRTGILKKTGQNKRSRVIEQIDATSGVVVASFSSVRHAATTALGQSHPVIKNAIKQGTSRTGLDGRDYHTNGYA